MPKTTKTKRREFPMLSEKTLADGTTEYRFMLGNRIVSRHAGRDEAQAAFKARFPQYFR